MSEYDDLTRNLRQKLMEVLQEVVNRYELQIQELKSELDDRESKLIAQQWKHDIERKEWMDKIKEMANKLKDNGK